MLYMFKIVFMAFQNYEVQVLILLLENEHEVILDYLRYIIQQDKKQI
jgi:hypothetical protein